MKKRSFLAFSFGILFFCSVGHFVMSVAFLWAELWQIWSYLWKHHMRYSGSGWWDTENCEKITQDTMKKKPKNLEILKKIQKNFRKIFENFLKNFWKNFEKFLKNFWKIFENFLKIFWNFFQKIFEKFSKNLQNTFLTT